MQRNVKVSERAYQYLTKKRDDHNETRLKLKSTNGEKAVLDGYWRKWSMADVLDDLITNREFLATELHRASYELRKERGQSVD